MRLIGDWEAWLDFFSEATIVTANQAVEEGGFSRKSRVLNRLRQDRRLILCILLSVIAMICSGVTVIFPMLLP
ncbi:MAG: hypothetical protein ABW160_20470 [Candidatus Thiodiazotropha sp. 4PDIV1]